MTPRILFVNDQHIIQGTPEGLESLGHALILKAKMGVNFQFTMIDGENTPINLMVEGEDYPHLIKITDKR
jgi:hypothetical protein